MFETEALETPNAFGVGPVPAQKKYSEEAPRRRNEAVPIGEKR